MPFTLSDFLATTGLTLPTLAAHLRVAPSYLQEVLAGRGSLISRDAEACRALHRQLTQAKQGGLPFAEAPETFSKEHAHAEARHRAQEETKKAGAPHAGTPGTPEQVRHP